MLSKAQEKRIRSLHRKKARRELGECLVEGANVIEAAGGAVEFTFTPKDTEAFVKLVTTQSPQAVAGVAKIPSFTLDDVMKERTVVVLDGVQDPGNVGAILRACLAFDGALVLIESADPTNSKVVRSSAGTMFLVPWVEMKRQEALEWLSQVSRPLFRLERHDTAITHDKQTSDPAILIAGSEGLGIQLVIDAPSLTIAHNDTLESLNVAQAVTIALAFRKST